MFGTFRFDRSIVFEGTHPGTLSAMKEEFAKTNSKDYRHLELEWNARYEHESRRWIASGLNVFTDSRLDNRKDLMKKLRMQVSPASAVSDAAIIRRAYEKWGEDCVDHLVGDFAFVVWDARHQTIFCARDHLGVRPFYYHAPGKTFAFSSRIKTLLAFAQLPPRYDRDRIADFLLQVHDDRESTFFEGVRRLPPGSAMRVSIDGITRWAYWRPNPERRVELPSDEAYAEVFREIFEESVRSRIEGVREIGCLLSGGLDSSSVTCVARSMIERRGQTPLQTFSMTFDGFAASDEREYMDAVARMAGIRPNRIAGEMLNPFEHFDRMLSRVEEPFYTGNLFQCWHLWKHARSSNVRVLLDGFLGDNVVSHGTRRLTELAGRGQWLALMREINLAASRMGNHQGSRRRMLRRFAIAPFLIEPMLRWRGRFRDVPRPAYAAFVSGDLLGGTKWRSDASLRRLSLPRTPRTEIQEHVTEINTGGYSGALEIAHKGAASFGIDLRFPFSDKRLVEFCLAIPADQKCRDGWTRVIARRAMRTYLPDKVRNRYGKATLHPVFTHAVMSNGADDFDRLVHESLPAASEYVDVEAARIAYDKMKRGVGNEPLLYPLWLCVTLARWLELEANGARRRTAAAPELSH